ncbi:MAG TPA: TatD family hydrolase [Candidatus Fournierella excrementigallinarum]|nr:TatD family hydrolase [Candidatus Fournierella excrementigallinarum]
MAGPIFDSHAHYQSRQFDGDRAALLQSLPAAGVAGVVECATDFATSKGALELAAAWPFVWAALGIHPESLIEEDASTNTQFSGDWKAELAAIAPLLSEKKAVAVGEIGLDYHWPVPKDAQLELFEAQIRLALELGKPVIVHDREAHADTYALLKKYRPKGVLHCFSGSAEDAAWLTAQGLYIGFGGAATFKGAKRAVKAAAAVPADKLLLETDCPYMAPEPCRGRRCDSSLIAHTAAFLAGVRGETPEQLLETACQNARALFGLG